MVDPTRAAVEFAIELLEAPCVKLDAESELGSGTTVTLLFPVVRASSALMQRMLLMGAGQGNYWR